MAVEVWFALQVGLFFGTFAVLAALCNWIEKLMQKKRR